MQAMDEDVFYKPRKQNDESNTTNERTERKKKVSLGKWTSTWRGSRRFCGWDPEGLLRFNELVAIVEQDRKEDLHFQAQYNIHLKRVYDKKNKRSTTQAAATVPVYRDLAALGV